MKINFERWVVIGSIAGLSLGVVPLTAMEDVYIDEVPDYEWEYGCFGTATGNLFGFWDRSGFPNFYTGPTEGGLAPLDSRQSLEHRGIQSLWASAAGVDGRPSNLPGHVDDYYAAYESVAPDPYIRASRVEHKADCIGDFIGLNQNKWSSLNGECRGNIDGYSFTYWEKTGARRWAKPGFETAVIAAADIPSGLIQWSRHRGYEAESFCQMPSFHPAVAAGRGFTFTDLKKEIDAGYPVLLFHQPTLEINRTVNGVPEVNPEMHGMLAFGYLVQNDGKQYVRFRTSWGTGDNFAEWSLAKMVPPGIGALKLRGVIGYHPKPKIQSIRREKTDLFLDWSGPDAKLVDSISGERRSANVYVVEQSEALSGSPWTLVEGFLSGNQFRFPAPTTGTPHFYRVRLL